MAEILRIPTAGKDVRSLELLYAPVVSTVSGEPLAYRSETQILTRALGTLTQRDYTRAVDFGSETGVRLSLWNVREGMRHVKQFAEAGLEPEFVSVRCTSSFADLPDACDKLRRIAAENDFEDFSRLCLEFPHTMLYRAAANGRRTVMDTKVLGVKTMISGCGSGDCPAAKLLSIPVDYAILDASLASWARDGERVSVLRNFVQYVRSMNVKVIADGVRSDEDIREFAGMDCLGAILSGNYEGSLSLAEEGLHLDDALALGGDD